MAFILLDGKAVSVARRGRLKTRITEFQEKAKREPHLVVILVGEPSASVVYVRNKEKACAAVGIKSTRVNLPAAITQDELNATIEHWSSDKGVDGILLQLPLPPHLNADDSTNRISVDKDVDALTTMSMGLLLAGKARVKPCTPQGIMNILSYYEIPIAGKTAVVVGRSNIVGKPMAQLLVGADATVTICHSATKDLRKWTKEADIVVVAAGRKEMLNKDDFKKNAVVVDVGIHGTGGTSLCGDVKWEGLEQTVAAATPVPGGVGPMTITTLLENCVSLAEARLGIHHS